MADSGLGQVTQGTGAEQVMVPESEEGLRKTPMNPGAEPMTPPRPRLEVFELRVKNRWATIPGTMYTAMCPQ